MVGEHLWKCFGKRTQHQRKKVDESFIYYVLKAVKNSVLINTYKYTRRIRDKTLRYLLTKTLLQGFDHSKIDNSI